MKIRFTKFNFPVLRSGKGAFTLIEILISMGILMMVVFAIYSSWSAILRGTRTAQEVAANAQRSRIAIRSIEDALLTAQVFSQNARYYSFVADTSSDYAALSLTARLPDTFPGSGIFGGQVLRRVTFTVEPGEDRKNQLVMTQFPLLLETNSDNQPYAITLARDVTMFEMKFWDTNENDWADEYLNTNQLPRLIRVTLGMGHLKQYSSEPSEIVSRIVALPSTIVTPDMQLPQAAAPNRRGPPGTLPPTNGFPFPPGDLRNSSRLFVPNPPVFQPGNSPQTFPNNPGPLPPSRAPRLGRGGR